MASFSLQDQRVIIRFLHLRGMAPIDIHRLLGETCGDGVMDVKNVRSWVRQFKEGRESCDNAPKEPRLRTTRTDNIIRRVEQVVMGERRLGVRDIASIVGISVGSVHTILHEDLKMRKVSSRSHTSEMADDNVAVSEKKRGRPSKAADTKEAAPKKAEKRGKPAEDKKNALSEATPAKRGRGRPKGSGKKGKAKTKKTTGGGGRGRGRPKKEEKLEKAAAESSGGDEEDDDDEESK